MEEMEGMEGVLLIQNKRGHDSTSACDEHMREDAVFLVLVKHAELQITVFYKIRHVLGRLTSHDIRTLILHLC